MFGATMKPTHCTHGKTKQTDNQRGYTSAEFSLECVKLQVVCFMGLGFREGGAILGLTVQHRGSTGRGGVWEECRGACLSSEQSEGRLVLRVVQWSKWWESFLVSLNMHFYAALKPILPPPPARSQ